MRFPVLLLRIKLVLPCSLDDNAEQGSCGSREKFSVLLQVVNGFEILVDKKQIYIFISVEMLSFGIQGH